MRRTLWVSLACLLAACSFLAGQAYSRQSKPLKIRDLMTDAEFHDAGLWKLSSFDLEALDAWITRYHDRLTKGEEAGEGGEEPDELKGKQEGEVCDTALVPAGWIKVGDHWNPTKCRATTGIEYNVWDVKRYSDKPVGTEMVVCSDAPTPKGWEEVSKRWNPTTCGHPTPITDNVKTIKRVE